MNLSPVDKANVLDKVFSSDKELAFFRKKFNASELGSRIDPNSDYIKVEKMEKTLERNLAKLCRYPKMSQLSTIGQQAREVED